MLTLWLAGFKRVLRAKEFLTKERGIGYLHEYECCCPSPPSPSCAQHVGGGAL